MRFAKAYESRVMVFYNLTLMSLIMLLLKQDPFRFHDQLTASMIPMDGQGLNPLLQNPWMVIHPPDHVHRLRLAGHPILPSPWRRCG